jgi:hypothetical protein
VTAALATRCSVQRDESRTPADSWVKGARRAENWDPRTRRSGRGSLPGRRFGTCGYRSASRQRQRGRRGPARAMRAAIIAAIVATLVSAASATAAFVVTSANIKNGTIQLVDLNDKTRQALRGRRGPRGFSGYEGLSGPQGPRGPSPTFTTAYSDHATVPPGSFGFVNAICPQGTAVVGGGHETSTRRSDRRPRISPLATASSGSTVRGHSSLHRGAGTLAAAAIGVHKSSGRAASRTPGRCPQPGSSRTYEVSASGASARNGHVLDG